MFSRNDNLAFNARVNMYPRCRSLQTSCKK